MQHMLRFTLSILLTLLLLPMTSLAQEGKVVWSDRSEEGRQPGDLNAIVKEFLASAGSVELDRMNSM